MILGLSIKIVKQERKGGGTYTVMQVFKCGHSKALPRIKTSTLTADWNVRAAPRLGVTSSSMCLVPAFQRRLINDIPCGRELAPYWPGSYSTDKVQSTIVLPYSQHWYWPRVALSALIGGRGLATTPDKRPIRSDWQSRLALYLEDLEEPIKS